MNIYNFAQVLAAVTSGSSFGGDMPCKNEIFEASFCILGDPEKVQSKSFDEINGAVECLMCPYGDAPGQDTITCDDVQSSTYCTSVEGCVESKCDVNSDCFALTSKYFQCIDNFFATSCGDGQEICPRSFTTTGHAETLVKSFLRKIS